MVSTKLAFTLLALAVGATAAHPYQYAAAYNTYAPSFAYASSQHGYARTALDVNPYYVNNPAAAAYNAYPAYGYGYPAFGFYYPNNNRFALAPSAPTLAVRAPLPLEPLAGIASFPAGFAIPQPVFTAHQEEPSVAPADENTASIERDVVLTEAADGSEPSSSADAPAGSFAIRRLFPVFQSDLRNGQIQFVRPEDAASELEPEAGKGVVVVDAAGNSVAGPKRLSLPAGIAQSGQPTFF